MTGKEVICVKKISLYIFVFALLFNTLVLKVSAATKEFRYDDNKDVVYYRSAPVKKATHNTKYRVIGYTVKYRSYSAMVKTVPFGDEPAGEDYVTTYFEIPAHNDKNYNGVLYKSIFTRLNESNPGHKDEFDKLWGIDNTLKFDAIMTIVENDEPLADMRDNGTFVKHDTNTKAQKGKDYFTTNAIKDVREWANKPDIDTFFEVPCDIKGIHILDPGPTVAHISKGNSIVDNQTLYYLDNDIIALSGDKSEFPGYGSLSKYPKADGKTYKWEYKSVSSSSWSPIKEGEGMVSPAFPKLGIGSYNVKLTVWYRIGKITYPEKLSSAQVTLNISPAPIGAYVKAELATEGDIMVTQAQIDSNALISIPVSVTGTLKNYADISKITQWKNHLRKDPSGADDQYQAFTYTSGLGLTQTSQKIFTVPAGVLKSVDSYTQKYAGASYVTVNGRLIQSKTEYCTVTLYKGTPPPPPVTNIPPVADISAPATVKVGDVFPIFGTGSYDPDGTIVRYIWNCKGADQNLPEVPYGDIVYSKEGEYTLLLIVVDDGGASSYTRVTITVVPPTPDAHFKVTGALKEKRIVSLENQSSSPTRYPLTPSKNKWMITPVAGSGAVSDAVYKVTNKSTDKLQVTGDAYTSTSFNGLNLPAALFSKAGQYDVTLTVTNTANLSDSETQRITIQPDLPPVSKFMSDQKIYRETIVNDVNYAKITVNDESYSPDGDFISYRKIWAIYDANNNGVFGDAADQTIVISETSDRNVIDTVKTYEYMTKEVGKYEVHVTVKESYNP